MAKPKIKTSFTMNANTLEELSILAKDNGRSMSNMLEQLIFAEAKRVERKYMKTRPQSEQDFFSHMAKHQKNC